MITTVAPVVYRAICRTKWEWLHSRLRREHSMGWVEWKMALEDECTRRALRARIREFLPTTGET